MSLTEEGKKSALRFHIPHTHLAPVFGPDWFGLKAEAFARFFGTPTFLGIQTILVTIWIILNFYKLVDFDPYPFILLNLVFSLQAAYAAPMILLAQTRQADRDKGLSEADAHHREELAQQSAHRENMELRYSEQVLELLRVNTTLTQAVHGLSQKIESLSQEINGKIVGVSVD